MRPRRLKNEINVVPYIDVMLVLLVIFMVATPMMQSAAIDLPSVGQAPQPPTQPLEVWIRADRSLALMDRASREARETSVTLAELPAAIRQAQEARPDQPVLVAGDKSVPYEAVLQVMDLLQKQHVKRIGLLVQPGAVAKSVHGR